MATGGDADLVLVNGIVYTVDAVRSSASALAVRNGRLCAVGTNRQVHDLVGPRTDVIDLKGRLVLPGFQDSHVHVSCGGLERSQCDLSQAHSLEQYLAIIDRYARARPELEWITGGGWSLDVFAGGVPHRQDLDRVAGGRPAFLSNRDHHAAWVNTAALRLAGLTAATPDPDDGRIERDERREPCGTLQEGAMTLVQQMVPPPSTEAIVKGISEGQRYLHSLGITAWQEAIVGDYPVVPDCYEAYRNLDSQGRLTGRVVGALWWERGRGEAQIDTLLERRAATLEGDRFRATAVKFMQDGVCENFTASMLEPYLDCCAQATGNSGKSFFDPEELKAFVTRVDHEGFQAHFHAIGDRAVREVLDAVAAARAANGASDRRHHVAHIQVIHPDDVGRFAALGVTGNAQPLWACNEAQMSDLTMPFLGPERSSCQYPFASLVRSGARLSFGSDWPVSTPDPLSQIHVAVNRTVPPGHATSAESFEPLLPDERLDLATAIGAFTIGSAYVNHLDEETGSLETGKRADLVVLDEDLFSLPVDELALATVDLTLVDGQPVYERSAG